MFLFNFVLIMVWASLTLYRQTTFFMLYLALSLYILGLFVLIAILRPDSLVLAQAKLQASGNTA